MITINDEKDIPEKYHSMDDMGDGSFIVYFDDDEKIINEKIKHEKSKAMDEASVNNNLLFENITKDILIDAIYKLINGDDAAIENELLGNYIQSRNGLPSRIEAIKNAPDLTALNKLK